LFIIVGRRGEGDKLQKRRKHSRREKCQTGMKKIPCMV